MTAKKKVWAVLTFNTLNTYIIQSTILALCSVYISWPHRKSSLFKLLSGGFYKNSNSYWSIYVGSSSSLINPLSFRISLYSSTFGLITWISTAYSKDIPWPWPFKMLCAKLDFFLLEYWSFFISGNTARKSALAYFCDLDNFSSFFAF